MSKRNVLRDTTDSHEGGKLLNRSMKTFELLGAFEAVQGLSDLFHIRLQNDDVEDFDARWDQVLLSASETPITPNTPNRSN